MASVAAGVLTNATDPVTDHNPGPIYPSNASGVPREFTPRGVPPAVRPESQSGGPFQVSPEAEAAKDTQLEGRAKCPSCVCNCPPRKNDAVGGAAQGVWPAVAGIAGLGAMFAAL